MNYYIAAFCLVAVIVKISIIHFGCNNDLERDSVA